MLEWVNLWLEPIFIGHMVLLNPNLPLQSRDWALFVGLPKCPFIV